MANEEEGGKIGLETTKRNPWVREVSKDMKEG